MSKLDTPCIGVCSTVYGDKVCRGCKRYFDEVIDWLAYTPEEKLAIFDRLNEHTTAIVSKYLNVVDEAKLKSVLDRWSIRYRDDHSPHSLAMQLLVFADEKIKSAESVGLEILDDYAALSFTDLCNTMDRELYRLSNEVFGERMAT